MRTSASHRFIDPRVLASISDLQLVARTVVDGFMFGEHRSTLAGAGVEFNQYRSYQPGDDPRTVDWKLYARSDRYYVREAEVETSINVRFLLDTSASMGLGVEGCSKLHYSKMAVASLAYLTTAQGDAAGLSTFGPEARAIPPRPGQLNLFRILHELEQLEPVGRWPDWVQLENSLDQSGGKQLVLLVTDLVERETEILDAASRLSQFGNELVLMHVAGDTGLASVDGSVELEDSETGKKIVVDASLARRTFDSAWADHVEMVKAALANEGVAYWYIPVSEPLDACLRSFLSHRAHMV